MKVVSQSEGSIHWLRFLKQELAPYPGRMNLVLRVLLASAIVMVTSLTLKVPFLMVSLLAVLTVTQANIISASIAAVMVFLGVTVSVGATILLLKFTFDYPFLRILGASVFFLFSVFMLRASKFGPAFFIAALNVIYIQTFVDLTDNAEQIVRQTLWVWVAMIYPAALSMLLNTVFLPLKPQIQLKKEIHRQLQIIDKRLAILLPSSDTSDSTESPSSNQSSEVKQTEITLSAVQKSSLTMQKLLTFAVKKNKDYEKNEAQHLATIATISRLLYAASNLPKQSINEWPSEKLSVENSIIDSQTNSSELIDAITELRSAIEKLDNAIASDETFALESQLISERREFIIAPIAEMQTALQVLADNQAQPSTPSDSNEESTIFVEDAFTNPAYPQFALKTLLAVIFAYTFYNSTDWQGIHTVMLTCLICAQSSVGASVQKGWLRIIGAIIGSLIALFMMVFIIPQIVTLVGVLMMTLPVIAASSWIMAGSERTSYIGFQIVVTFGLALLMDFSPTTDTGEISDRMIGVLLGVIITMVVFIWVWPEGEGKQARRNLADLLRSISQLLQPIAKSRETDDSTEKSEGEKSESEKIVAQQQVAALTELSNCESVLARIALEPNGRESQQEGLTQALQTVLAQAHSVMLAANKLRADLNSYQHNLPTNVRDALYSVLEEAATALDEYADDLASDEGCLRLKPISMERLEQSFASDSITDINTDQISGQNSTSKLDRRKATIIQSVENVVYQLANLPSWGLSTSPENNYEGPPRHA